MVLTLTVFPSYRKPLRLLSLTFPPTSTSFLSLSSFSSSSPSSSSSFFYSPLASVLGCLFFSFHRIFHLLVKSRTTYMLMTPQSVSLRHNVQQPALAGHLTGALLLLPSTTLCFLLPSSISKNGITVQSLSQPSQTQCHTSLSLQMHSVTKLCKLGFINFTQMPLLLFVPLLLASFRFSSSKLDDNLPTGVLVSKFTPFQSILHVATREIFLKSKPGQVHLSDYSSSIASVVCQIESKLSYKRHKAFIIQPLATFPNLSLLSPPRP